MNSSNKWNSVDSPPLVNLAFSIELYIKLLRCLADGQLMQGHNLHDLFLKLEKASPAAATAVICQHRYARGDRDEFLENLNDTKSVFEDWRYAYESELLIAVPDNVHALADAFRAALGQMYPEKINVYQSLPIPAETLSKWAATKPTIKTLYVFGSYARGEARADSDLDLAFEFIETVDEQLAELVANAAVWKAELTRLTRITVKDLYLSTDEAAEGPVVEVYTRE